MSVASRTLTSLLTGALLGLGLAAFPVAPATAGTTYLCTGYDGCAKAGYSSSGYQQAAKNSYWRMYAGHNCTNYVAYRLVQAGMSADRPFTGTGNAWNWGVQMASKTDGTPSVGAVAWFNRGVRGAGSVGHVAYVEQVVSASEIIVSEDSYGGDFHWRRITTASGWPSGFVHLVDRALVNTAPVTINGTPAVGETLTASAGSWSQGATFSYQWSADGAPIAGATAPDLKVTSDLAGKSLTVRVTAMLAGYATTAADSAAVAISLGSLTPSGAPTVSGVKKTALVGTTLTASRPTFSPTPRAVSVQWYADGAPIAGATAWSYALTGDTVLKNITVVATGQRPGYAATPATSAPVGPVLAGRISVDRSFAIKGPAAVGKKLSVAGGSVKPADAGTSYTWQRNGAPIAGANGTSYRITAEDAGAQLSVLLTTTRTGWLDRRTVLTRAAHVASTPSFTVKTAGRSGRAVVWFRVQAPGVAKPGGAAVVTIGGVSRTVTVRRGVGRLKVSGLAPGKRAVTIAFGATSRVLAGSVDDQVRVRR